METPANRTNASDETPSRKGFLDTVNPYVGLAENEYSDWVFTDEQAQKFRGKWREQVFSKESLSPLDLEIGVGNGYFFEHYSKENPDRSVIGLELKYKPLIQTVRRAIRAGSKNMRAIRYDASLVDEIFAEAELDHVFIFFPDPWPKKRHHKNRLITREFLMNLYDLQKPGSKLEIKTDNVEYFDWITERVPKTPYKVEIETRDLHSSEWGHENFMTHFEKLWTGKGLKTHYLRLRR